MRARTEFALGILSLGACLPWLYVAEPFLELFRTGAVNGLTFLAVIVGTMVLVLAGSRLLAGTSKGKVVYPLALLLLSAVYLLTPFLVLWVKLPSVIAALAGAINAFVPPRTGT